VSYQRLVGEAFWAGDDAPNGPSRDASSRENPGPDDDRWFDLKLTSDASAGFYTNASVGGRARFGLVDSPFWNAERLPIDSVFVPPTPMVTGPGGAESRFWLSEIFLFASGGATAWGYNSLLQGQFRESTVALSFEPGAADAARLKRLVGDAQAGITARKGRFSATYAITWHSALFGGPFERSHSWGALYLGFGSKGAQ
jgi:hypothetical protein